MGSIGSAAPTLGAETAAQPLTHRGRWRASLCVLSPRRPAAAGHSRKAHRESSQQLMGLRDVEVAAAIRHYPA